MRRTSNSLPKASSEFVVLLVESGIAPQNSGASLAERRGPWPLNSRSRGRKTAWM